MRTEEEILRKYIKLEAYQKEVPDMPTTRYDSISAVLEAFDWILGNTKDITGLEDLE